MSQLPRAREMEGMLKKLCVNICRRYLVIDEIIERLAQQISEDY